ncbi:hypothetical protein AN958_07437 [Leucoagaricus sp. SymC.cos]|nr:hypothetical protein AN958_07437 [Leucoagaricus sp. SymC.cos]
MGVTDIQPGRRYRLTNVKTTDNVLDLSGADNRSLIGYAWNGGDNQKWLFERNNDGWTIRNVATGLYASIDSHSNGAKVVGRQEPFTWHIWHAENGNNQQFRISVPNVKKSLDLSNHGQGPDIEIWGQWQGENQLWYLDEGKFGTSRG